MTDQKSNENMCEGKKIPLFFVRSYHASPLPGENNKQHMCNYVVPEKRVCEQKRNNFLLSWKGWQRTVCILLFLEGCAKEQKAPFPQMKKQLAWELIAMIS